MKQQCVIIPINANQESGHSNILIWKFEITYLFTWIMLGDHTEFLYQTVKLNWQVVADTDRDMHWPLSGIVRPFQPKPELVSDEDAQIKFGHMKTGWI